MQLLLIFLMFVMIAVWIIVPLSIRSDLISMFRYKLWRIRDELMDDILDRKLPDVPATRELLKSIEQSIRCAGLITLSRYLFLPPCSKEERESTNREMEVFEAIATEPQRERYCSLVRSVQNAFAKHLLLSSPAGWLIVSIGMLVLLMYTLGLRVSEPFVQAKTMLVTKLVPVWRIFRHLNIAGSPPLSACN